MLARASHTYLSMFGLLAISFFAITGFMLNHPQWFDTDVVNETHGVTGVLANLHRGTSAGGWWKLFIDLTAGVLILAVFTGLVVWFSLPKRRLWGIVALVIGSALAIAAYLA
jgi:hypothetical protein